MVICQAENTAGIGRPQDKFKTMNGRASTTGLCSRCNQQLNQKVISNVVCEESNDFCKIAVTINLYTNTAHTPLSNLKSEAKFGQFSTKIIM